MNVKMPRNASAGRPTCQHCRKNPQPSSRETSSNSLYTAPDMHCRVQKLPNALITAGHDRRFQRTDPAELCHHHELAEWRTTAATRAKQQHERHGTGRREHGVQHRAEEAISSNALPTLTSSSPSRWSPRPSSRTGTATSASAGHCPQWPHRALRRDDLQAGEVDGRVVAGPLPRDQCRGRDLDAPLARQP